VVARRRVIPRCANIALFRTDVIRAIEIEFLLARKGGKMRDTPVEGQSADPSFKCCEGVRVTLRIALPPPPNPLLVEMTVTPPIPPERGRRSKS
jgi:hypothetical protein